MNLYPQLQCSHRYVGLRPPEAEARAALVAEIERVVRQHCPGATVATFGSMTASLGALCVWGALGWVCGGQRGDADAQILISSIH